MGPAPERLTVVRRPRASRAWRRDLPDVLPARASGRGYPTRYRRRYRRESGTSFRDWFDGQNAAVEGDGAVGRIDVQGEVNPIKRTRPESARGASRDFNVRIDGMGESRPDCRALARHEQRAQHCAAR
jgi:hypothetical protein